MPDIVRVEHLSYIYGQGMPDATVALDDISFSIEEGSFVGVIGSTGCGKSTLIGHFNGINRPTQGKVYIDGEDIWQGPKDIRRFRFLVGLVFQYPEYQLFEETVYKDIAFGPLNMGLSEEEVNRRVLRAAKFCGLRGRHAVPKPVRAFRRAKAPCRHCGRAGHGAKAAGAGRARRRAGPGGPRHHFKPGEAVPSRRRAPRWCW